MNIGLQEETVQAGNHLINMQEDVFSIPLSINQRNEQKLPHSHSHI